MFDENEAMTGEHLPFGSGQPTQPDVDELIKKWPPSAIKPGEWQASDTEIGAVFGSPSETRYKTVCAAWRRRLLNDHRVILYRVKGWGYHCPVAERIYSRTAPTLKTVTKKVRGHLHAVMASQPVNEIESITKNHHSKFLQIAHRELRNARKTVLPSMAAAEMPKITRAG